MLLVSSHASALSSHACFQKSTIQFTESMVALLFSTTFFPEVSVSAPPKPQTSG